MDDKESRDTVERRICCFIKCNKNAEFEIYDNNDARDTGVTDSCEEHVGQLLGSADPVAPTGPWTVVCILKKEI